jgi:SnoaL-like domain
MSAFARCLHEDFVYTDPNIRTVGYDELATYMDGFQQQIPGGGFVNRDIANHHDSLLVHWDMTGPDGAVLSPGASFGTIHSDGRLASMTGFYAQ